MGWTYPYGASRQTLIQDRTKSWERELDGGTVETTCLASCFRGGRFSGVLWAVWERKFEKDGVTSEPDHRWITCDLIQCHGGEWGYKDLSEACGPYYYSCPLKYLELVPMDQYGGNANWRREVHRHHDLRRAKRQRNRQQIAK